MRFFHFAPIRNEKARHDDQASFAFVKLQMWLCPERHSKCSLNRGVNMNAFS